MRTFSWMLVLKVTCAWIGAIPGWIRRYCQQSKISCPHESQHDSYKSMQVADTPMRTPL